MPSPVDRYFEQIKEKNPSYSDAQAWATAWSIYCKYKNPDSESCHMPTSEYFKGKSAAERVMVAGLTGTELHDAWEKAEHAFAAAIQKMSGQPWKLKKLDGPTQYGEVTLTWESEGQGTLILYGASMSPKMVDVRLHYEDPKGMPEQPQVMRVPNEKVGDPSIITKLLAKYKKHIPWMKAANVMARFLARSASEHEGADDPADTISQGDVFIVQMKHGDWWTEMRKGVKMKALESGKLGEPIEVLDLTFAGFRKDGIPMTFTKLKDGKYRMTDADPSRKRALTVTRA
jgi:hypothetical protein